MAEIPESFIYGFLLFHVLMTLEFCHFCHFITVLWKKNTILQSFRKETYEQEKNVSVYEKWSDRCPFKVSVPC